MAGATTQPEAMAGYPVCLSVVSHGQRPLLDDLLGDLAGMRRPAELVVTDNLLETRPLPALPGLQHRCNPRPLGFADNHNRALKETGQPFLAVVNPDIRLPVDPFPDLLACFADPTVGLVAPRVLAPDGRSEDNARRFPGLTDLLRKALGGDDGRYPVRASGPQPVDWAAGMFLLIRAEAFHAVSGFDPGFHLYYEDVDLCARLWRRGWKVVWHPGVTVVHHAQRASRRHWRYMLWHARSMARYLIRHRPREQTR